jgi:hypothetical protein
MHSAVGSRTALRPAGQPRRRAESLPLSIVRSCAGALVCVLLSAAAGFADPAAAGRIKSASGTAFVLRQGNVIPVQQAGGLVFEGDGLRTGPDGHLAVTLKDDTRVSLDPNTELHLDRFAYAPADGRLGVVLKMVHGVFAYVSGRIAKLSPDAVRLETPNAIVGIRGTHLVIRVGTP